MTRLVDDLKTRYRSRIVVFDLPPLLRAADVIAFAPNIEAAVLVVAEGETAGEDVTRCTELLGETRLIGTVLNKSLELRLPADKEYRMIDPPAGWRSGRSA
jgi:Mrp family chromosome partitioning ATPase